MRGRLVLFLLVLLLVKKPEETKSDVIADVFPQITFTQDFCPGMILL